MSNVRLSQNYVCSSMKDWLFAKCFQCVALWEVLFHFLLDTLQECIRIRLYIEQ